jgi:AcrR family transcriptional regulator
MTPPGTAGNDPRGQASARRRDGIRRRDELLDAALTCFSERGLLSTRIEDIRRVAGASPSSVYNLFDGLPSLTVTLLARTFERLFAHVTSRALAHDRPEGAVRALVDGHLEWVLGHQDQARFMYGAMALELARAQQEELAELKASLAVPVMRHLASVAGDGALPAWPASTLEFIILGPAHEACRRYLAGAPVDLAGLRELLPDVAWESVSAFAAAAQAREPTAG